MNTDQYNEYLNSIIEETLKNYLVLNDPMYITDKIVSLKKQGDNLTLDAISYWQQKLTNTIKEKVKGYGDMFLSEIDEELRYTATALIWDINYHQRLRYLEKSLQKYSVEQPLFVSNEKLLFSSLNRELISSTEFQKDYISNVVQFPNGKYAYIDELVEPYLLKNIEARDITYYVRLNPLFYYDQKPPFLIKDEAWRKPSPKWVNAIGIKPNCKDGFSYYIPDDIDINTNGYEHYDRYILGIFRLEGEYKRLRDGYFSMMVEELKEVKHPFCEDYYLIGRMIHLDSDESCEKGLDTKLKHIDLALNLYTGDNAIKRRNERLENGGRIVDASFRSHILRMNDTKLSDVILFSTFFKSKSLQNEWIKEMFNIEEKKDY